MTARSVLLGIAVAGLTGVVGAQSGTQATTTHKTTTTTKKPVTAGPTKVTGDGTKTASGLQYWDIKEGTGAVAQTGQTAKMHYTGWLTTGKKFDSSIGSQPYQFIIGHGDVIKGWDEGVLGMKVGGKRQLRIPPNLAYGSQGYPGVIPPESTLIFDVQLVDVK
jgi:FKBP-type peptidyl-prolyl cis-trans isomerase FkpA